MKGSGIAVPGVTRQGSGNPVNIPVNAVNDHKISVSVPESFVVVPGNPVRLPGNLVEAHRIAGNVCKSFRDVTCGSGFGTVNFREAKEKAAPWNAE